MKATFDDEGFLELQPENGAEAFTLNWWFEQEIKPVRKLPRWNSSMVTTGAVAYKIPNYDEDVEDWDD